VLPWSHRGRGGTPARLALPDSPINRRIGWGDAQLFCERLTKSLFGRMCHAARYLNGDPSGPGRRRWSI
jgi:hypothetical protein